jgi:hypothetical protein
MSRMTQQKKVTFQELLDRAIIAPTTLAREAGVDPSVVRSMLERKSVRRVKALDVLRVLNARLQAEYTLNDIEGIVLFMPKKKNSGDE